MTNYHDHRLLGKRFTTALFFLALSSFAFSQSLDPKMDKLVEKLNLLAVKSPLELIYLQTNKDIYETGEDLWFKAYILDSHSFIPSVSSKTLYLQLIDEKTGEALWNEKYEIKKGFSDGHLLLQENLTEGDYLLAAYTGNTLFRDSTASSAICRITVKKDMKPRITVTHDFNRLYYRPNDSIKVTCSVLNEYGEIPPHAEIQAELRQGDKKLKQEDKKKGLATFQTNPKGEATVVFPPQKSGEGLSIDMKVKYSIKEVSLSIPVPCKKGSPIQFNVFPEGGNLVSELPSRLAFKAVDIDGAPLDVEGTLFEDKSPIQEFKSTHAGMGSMMIIPVAGKKYHITLSKPKTDSIFLLPKVYPQGIAMRLGKRDDKFLELFVSQSPEHAKRTVYLRGQLRGGVYCSASGVLSDELKFRVPLDQFPFQGIAEFTLFDDTLMPIAERLVYIKPDKKLYIETTLSKQKYETREKASLKIKVKDENGNPVTANLGVSVFDKIYYNPENPKNILSYFFLTSQLKGQIYDPAFYFDTRNKERDGALDLLLLTQGWRRYVWNEDNLKVYGNTKQVISDWTQGEVYDSIIYEKHIKESKIVNKERPIKEPKIIKAYNPESGGVAEKIMTDSSGIFHITPALFKKGQGGYVYVSPFQLTKEQLDNVKHNPANQVKDSLKIRLSDPFQTINENRIEKEINYPISKPKPLKPKPDSISPFLGNHSAIKLPEFVVKGKSTHIFREKYIGYLDSLAKAQTLDYVVCMGYSKNFQFLNLPGYEFNPIEKEPDYGKRIYRAIKIKPVEGEYYWRMGIGNAHYGGVGHKGMNKGDLISYFQDYRPVIYHFPKYTEDELLKKYNLSRVKGYYAHREFYQPNYDKVSDENLIADYRNTLLWAPSVITDDKGEATLEFFCSDVNYNFVGRIEGVSGTGLLGTKEFDFTVKRTINSK
jgi:hypothetical protein